MKKYIAFLGLAIASIAGTGMVQAQSSSPLHIGIKAGANYTKVSTSSSLTGKYNFGYQGGAMARLDISRAYIQGELLFNHRKSDFSSQEGKSKLSWNSVDLPVVIGYKIVDQGTFNVRAFAGGLYSYSFNREISRAKDVNEIFTKFDKSNIGLTAGLGVDIDKLSIDLRYETGLSNISKDFKSKPFGFSVGVGYFIF